MDFDALMKKKLGGKYNKPSLVEIPPQTEDGQDQAKPKNKGQKKATFKPRVTCSQCDFVGIDGKEMDIHRKKHDRSFNCEECQFVAKFRIVLRRHQIKEHNKKCHHCDFSAATSASLKMHIQAEHGGGLLSNSAGFMITGDGSGGQFMVYGEGTLLTELLSTGLVFDSRVVMMANEFNMDTKDVNLENDKEP